MIVRFRSEGTGATVAGASSAEMQACAAGVVRLAAIEPAAFRFEVEGR